MAASFSRNAMAAMAFWCFASGKKGPVKPLISISAVQQDEYQCTRCRWTAKVLRAALGEHKWGRRAGAAAQRRNTAQKVLEAADQQKVCSKRRFPKRIRIRQKRDTMRVSFVDENEPEVNGGFRYRDVTENMQVVVDGLVRHCEQMLPQLQGELLTRAYRFTEQSDEFRVSTAFTDRYFAEPS
ncbi:unnamed protein product [Cladocopium goreaui]|uniref:Peptidyl-tRNA hydrolase n=1 Tax=Cladocopium goreaui TaxID=2562237 RepID=A0A9P1CRD1_9DINO|nr:unnamed protein product [Cladocopium goreaui]